LMPALQLRDAELAIAGQMCAPHTPLCTATLSRPGILRISKPILCKSSD
jgi:hypothetical protein